MIRLPLPARARRAALYAAAFGIIGFAGFPFYWMLVTAFKQNGDLYVGAWDRDHVPWIFNLPPTLEHVRVLLQQTDFPRWAGNTALVVAAVALITVAVAVPAGYSLARLAGRAGTGLGIGIFFSYLIPPTLLFLPFSRLISVLGLEDSLLALVLIYPTMTIPFCTWLVMGFVRSIPPELEEQAMTDGLSRLDVILRLAPRLALPGVLTVAVFTFTLVLQEFVYALTFISSVDRMTLSLGARAGRRLPLGIADGRRAADGRAARDPLRPLRGPLRPGLRRRSAQAVNRTGVLSMGVPRERPLAATRSPHRAARPSLGPGQERMP